MFPEEPFITLARIRILLVPVGAVDRETFDRWTECIKPIDRIPLCDVPEDRNGRSRFMPPRLAPGHLYLNHEIYDYRDGQRTIPLTSLSRTPMGVIGIARASSTDQLATLGANFKAQMEELLPPGTLFPLAKNCFAFQDEKSRFSLDTKDAFSGLVVIPHDMGNKQLYLITLIAELCSAILAGFSDFATVLESEHGNAALNASLFPLGANFSLNSHAQTISPQSEVDLARTMSPINYRSGNVSSQSTIAETASPLVIGDRRGSSVRLKSPDKKRSSGVSAVHTHARLYRLLGDLYLMSGRVTDATIWYQQSIESFKVTGDNTWHAGALEGLCSCLLLEAFSITAGVIG